MSEFVTKGINNASHGLTVKVAMEKIGMKEYVISFLDTSWSNMQPQQQGRYSPWSGCIPAVPPGYWRRLVRPLSFSPAFIVQKAPSRMVDKEKSKDRGGILA